MIHPVVALDILRTLDVDRALALSPYTPPGGIKDTGKYADTRETALAGIHKARLAQKRHFTKAEITASRKWLYDNGWTVEL